MLTSYTEVEELPKEGSEYDKTHMVLEDHLCPNCPVEEASIRWVPQPPAAEVGTHLGDYTGKLTYAYTPSFTSR